MIDCAGWEFNHCVERARKGFTGRLIFLGMPRRGYLAWPTLLWAQTFQTGDERADVVDYLQRLSARLCWRALARVKRFLSRPVSCVCFFCAWKTTVCRFVLFVIPLLQLAITG